MLNCSVRKPRGTNDEIFESGLCCFSSVFMTLFNSGDKDENLIFPSVKTHETKKKIFFFMCETEWKKNTFHENVCLN